MDTDAEMQHAVLERDGGKLMRALDTETSLAEIELEVVDALVEEMVYSRLAEVPHYMMMRVAIQEYTEASAFVQKDTQKDTVLAPVHTA